MSMSKHLNLNWNSDYVPHGSVDDTHVTDDKHTVVMGKSGGQFHLVRARESITPESGTMRWRVRCESQFGANANFCLGVVSSLYHGTDYRHPLVWTTRGNGSWWSVPNGGQGGSSIPPNEDDETISYYFNNGDVVDMSYDPDTQLLTAVIVGQPGFLTKRRLEGDGLAEVNPCIFLWNYNTCAVALSRVGLSHEEYTEQKQNQRNEIIKVESLRRAEIVKNEAAGWQRLRQKACKDDQRILVGEQVNRAMGMLFGVIQSVAALQTVQQQHTDILTNTNASLALVRDDVHQLQAHQREKNDNTITLLSVIQNIQNTQLEIQKQMISFQRDIQSQDAVMQSFRDEVCADINKFATSVRTDVGNFVARYERESEAGDARPEDAGFCHKNDVCAEG